MKNTKEEYYGQFFKGEYHGHGKLILPTGYSYEGNFKKGKLHGNGEIQCPEGEEIYDGKFSSNQLNGDGIFKEIKSGKLIRQI